MQEKTCIHCMSFLKIDKTEGCFTYWLQRNKYLRISDLKKWSFIYSQFFHFWQGSVVTGYLCSTWHQAKWVEWCWRIHLQNRSFTAQQVGAGCHLGIQLGWLPETLILLHVGLPKWLVGLPRAQRLSSKWEDTVAVCLQGWAHNWFYIASVVVYWSK